MRVPICVGCNALMEPKVEDSKWLVCHKCRLWFPREFVRRNHRDRDMKRVWELQPCPWLKREPKEKWVRISKGPGPKEEDE